MSVDNDIVDDLNEDVESDIRDVDYTGLTIAGLDFSASTLASQITDGFINLSPEFQRRDAWNDEKRSRFIESLILHVPIPQIVLAEREPGSGSYFVLDGRQRLMTVAALYDADFRRWRQPRFEKLYELQELNGVTLDDFVNLEQHKANFQRFRTAALRCSILSAWRSYDVLYDIFYRLNSGSVSLTGQELRQVFYSGSFANFLFRVTNEENPLQQVLRISAPDPRFTDSELILRLIAFMMGAVPYAGNMKAFLDSTMEILNQQWARESENVKHTYQRILNAFDVLDSLIELRNVGRRPRLDGNFDGRFNRAIFEVQVYYFATGEITPAAAAERHDAYIQALVALLDDGEFRQTIEASTKTIGRVRQRFELYRALIREVFGVEANAFPIIADRAGA